MLLACSCVLIILQGPLLSVHKSGCVQVCVTLDSTSPQCKLSMQAQQQADEQAFVEQPSSQLNRQQTEPDSAFLQPGPLWESYRHCALRARRKNAGRRTRSFALLKLPDGRQVGFGNGARAAIDPNILARIRQQSFLIIFPLVALSSICSFLSCPVTCCGPVSCCGPITRLPLP